MQNDTFGFQCWQDIPKILSHISEQQHGKIGMQQSQWRTALFVKVSLTYELQYHFVD